MEKEKNTSQSSASGILNLLNDVRVIRAVAQIIFVILVFLALWLVWSNIQNTLRENNLTANFEFLDRLAQFAISDSPEWYSSTTGTFGQAFLVGIVNTLKVVSIGLVAATILGALLGVFLLSNNWIVRAISRVYVEVLRNTPIYVQLIFWYFVVFLSLPVDNIAIPSEGIFILWLRFIPYLLTLIGMWIYISNDENAPPRLINGVLTGILMMEIGFFIFGGDSVLLMGAFGIAGVALLGAVIQGRIPTSYDGLARGVAVIAVVQLVGHVMLYFMFQAEMISHPQLVYDPVMPAVYLGRQRGFVAPALAINERFGFFFGFFMAGIFFGWIVSNFLNELGGRTGRKIPSLSAGIATWLVLSMVGWFAASSVAPTISLGFLPESGWVGLPTISLSAALLVLFAALAYRSLRGAWKATQIGMERNWTPFLLAVGVYVVIAVFVLRLTVPAVGGDGYITTRLWETTYTLQRSIANFSAFFVVAVIGLIVAVALFAFAKRLQQAQQYDLPAIAYAVLAFVGIAWIGVGYSNLPTETEIVIDGEVIPYEQAVEEELLEPEELRFYSPQPLEILLPEQNNFGRFTTGVELSPRYLALVVGLVIYTSAFIGEIVRAGIQAVPYGQIEAARALGISQSETLRLIVLPQALRVIIPPLGNQYLNLAKNSSLALAVAYSDTFQIGTTIMNQSGQSITGFAIILGIYLVMSLVISFVMNIVNSRFQLVTR